MPKVMGIASVEQEKKKGKGNGTKPKKPSDEVEDSKETRKCYTCGQNGHIARDCSENQQNRDDPNPQSVTPIVQHPPHLCFQWGYLLPGYLLRDTHTIRSTRMRDT